MPASRFSIHRTILNRILPAWLLLSLIMGGAAYWLESRRVDQYVFALASEAADRFDRAKEQTWFQGEAQAHLTELRALMRENQFAGMRLFDRDRKPLLVAWDRPDPDLVCILERRAPVFPALGAHLHAAVRSEGRLVILAMVSLVGADRRPIGYFEGAYLVPAATRAAIETRVWDTLLMVLVVASLTTLILYPLIVGLNRDTVRLSQGLLESMMEFLRVLGSAIAKRDSETDSHNYRVTLYAIHLAERLGRPRAEIAPLIAGAFLHDVGKIGIPDRILLKPGRLAPDEMAVMRTHAAMGGEIVQESIWLARAREVVLGHHEWVDGSGYPEGLKGEAIPFNARLFAIVDVFDALTSRRPYKDPMPLEEALATMRQEAARHFDPELFPVFESVAGEFLGRFGSLGTPALKACLTGSIQQYFPVLGTAFGASPETLG